MKRVDLRRHGRLLPGGMLFVWLLAGLLIVPPILERVYRSTSFPVLDRRSLDFFLSEWISIVWIGAFAFPAAWLFVRCTRSERFAERFVPPARPSDVGAIRVLVAAVLLTSTLWEDVSSTALLPRSMMDPVGVMGLVAGIPGYSLLTASEVALNVFEWVTALVLFCAMVGWKTRYSVPLGAVLYLLLGGFLRQYAWFYHTGLLALYLLVVLSFLRSGAAVSVDRIVRRRRGDHVEPDAPSRSWGWARYALWTTLTIPYLAAGLSKLRNGGLEWLDAANFKFILFQSTLRPMEFGFDVSLNLATAPDWLIEAMAISAVLGEILYILNLFSRRARWIMPSVIMLMHVSILFLQNILFFDLIVLQVIFFNFRPALAVLRNHVSSRFESGRPIAAPVLVDPGLRSRGALVTGTVAVILSICWVFRIEFYPLTGMQMFSSTRTEPVTYEQVFAHYESGDIKRAPIEETIHAMSDGRFRRVLERSFRSDTEETSSEFFTAVGAIWNERVPDRKIESFEVQRWEWHYLSDPHAPDRGHLVAQRFFSVGGEATLVRPP